MPERIAARFGTPCRPFPGANGRAATSGESSTVPASNPLHPLPHW